ncbi:hypothetical protein BH11PAT4_BH11PAT4_4190 [soil metagenome]
MSDWSNGLQLPDEKPAEHPAPLHEERVPAPVPRHETTPHDSHARSHAVPHAEKHRSSKGKSTGITQAQAGIAAAAILVTALTLLLAHRSTTGVYRAAESQRSTQASKGILAPGVWVAEDFVINFSLPDTWEVLFSDTDTWIASYSEEGMSGQLEVSIQSSTVLDRVGPVKATIAGIEGVYSQESQVNADSGVDVTIVSVALAVPYKERAIQAQFSIQGDEAALTDAKIASVTSELKKILSDATLE